MSQCLLLVEDEDSLAIGLVDVLRLKGYEVERASSGEEALQMLGQQRFHLVLCDVSLPQMNGFEVLKWIRQQPALADLSVIMLTSRSTEMDRVLGFELGADDYVTKPFSLLELLGRIAARLRRGALPLGAIKSDSSSPLSLEGSASRENRLVFAGVTVDLDAFRLSNSRESTLPTKAFEILKVLAARPNCAVDKDTLFDLVWGDDQAVSLKTLNNLVVKIRQAIEPEPERPRYLVTVHGVGYRLDF